MAVTSDQHVNGFDAFHFDSDEFDEELLNEHGSPAEFRMATRCACWLKETGQPDPACRLCWPLGFVYDAPEVIQAFGPNRRPTRRFDAAGSYDASDAFFTLPTRIIPSFGSRITLPLSEIIVDDILTKGSEDITRYYRVLELQQAHYVVRVPPTGHPYQNERRALVFQGVNPHITLIDRTIVWNPATTASIPDGTRYVVRLKVLVEYLCWEFQERNENGLPLPGRCLGKRVDYLHHPRGAQPLVPAA